MSDRHTHTQAINLLRKFLGSSCHPDFGRRCTKNLSNTSLTTLQASRQHSQFKNKWHLPDHIAGSQTSAPLFPSFQPRGLCSSCCSTQAASGGIPKMQLKPVEQPEERRSCQRLHGAPPEQPVHAYMFTAVFDHTYDICRWGRTVYMHKAWPHVSYSQCNQSLQILRFCAPRFAANHFKQVALHQFCLHPGHEQKEMPGFETLLSWPQETVLPRFPCSLHTHSCVAFGFNWPYTYAYVTVLRWYMRIWQECAHAWVHYY